jgi:hypothetical protein
MQVCAQAKLLIGADQRIIGAAANVGVRGVAIMV